MLYLQSQVIFRTFELIIDAALDFANSVTDLDIDLCGELLTVVLDDVCDRFLDLSVGLSDQAIESVREVSFLVDEGLFDGFDLAAE